MSKGLVKLPRYWARRMKYAYLQWRTNYRIEAMHDAVKFTHPISWLIDDPQVITLGKQVSIGPFCEIVVLASDPMSCVPGALQIGNESVIGAMCNIRAAGGAIRIGDNCLIGQNVSLIASNHQVQSGSIYWQLRYDETKTGVHIGNNCWIGAGTIILPGCKVGDNAVVAAGSVVTKNVPANEVWGNIPARKIRDVQSSFAG